MIKRSKTPKKEQVEQAGLSSQSSFVTLNVSKNLINCTEIIQVLDRFKISDNPVTMLVASFIKACQGDVTTSVFHVQPPTELV